MHDNFPFSSLDSKRVLEHPDTPSAYVEWRELFPMLSEKKIAFLGNKLDWKYPYACRTLGSSRHVFSNIFSGVSEDALDEWMYGLASLSSIDFIDFAVPFMENFQQFNGKIDSDMLIRSFQTELLKETSIRYPLHLIVEITQSCNFACTMCSSRTDGYRPNKTMALEDFGEIVRVLGTRANSIRLNGYGESTTIPHFKDYVGCLDIFHFKGTKEIVTNLSGPTDIYLDMAKIGFLEMVSWDATEKYLFETIRRGSNYDRMLSTLKEVGRSLSHEPERLILLSTIQEMNVKEIPKIVQLASEVGAGMVIFNMVKETDGSPWMERRYDEIRLHFQTAKSLADDTGIKVKIPDHIGEKPSNLEYSTPTSMTKCTMPGHEVMVHWDLELTICNMFNPYSYGQLFIPNVAKDQQNMEQRAPKLINGVNARVFQSLEAQLMHPYCKECYFM